MRSLVATAAALLALSVPAAVSASTSAPTSGVTPISYVTVFSDPGEFVGGGQQRFYTTTEGDSVAIAGTAESLSVNVSGGTFGDSFTLDFAAAPGQTLHPGLYTNAQRAPFRAAGHPGMDISGDGRGCNTVGGRFDVKSIVTNEAGSVVSLWLTYEEHCENGTPALFGEVRIHSGPQTPLQPVPRMVWWPDTPVGTGSQTIPVTYFALGTSPVTVSSVQLLGPDKSHFQVKEDDCTGISLSPGDACQVWMRFVPLAKGPRMARLSLKASGGTTRTVQLDGFAIGGRTSLVIHSDSGDFVGQGLSYDYKLSDASIDASGSHTVLHAAVSADGGSNWSLDFEAPSGDILTPGTTYDAVRYPFNNDGAGMDIFGNGRGCNTLTGTFTVNSLSTALDGSLRSASISFAQHCEGAQPALHGTLNWRVPTGDNTAPSAVSGLTAARSDDGTKTTVSWTNPTDADWAHTIVRYLASTQTPGSPNGSLFGYSGRGTSVTLPVAHTQPITVAVYAVDHAGNMSAVQTATLSPS
jgi:hypothetical protein